MPEFSGLTPGQMVPLRPGLSCVLAPNPSPMTGPGTNTYLLGTDSLIIIDPGPQSDAHLAALTSAIADRPVSHIVVTHAHLDHSPLAGPLAGIVDAPVLAVGDATAGRSDVMERLAAEGLTGGGDGLDHDLSPDERIADGDRVTGDGGTLEVLHTPGHLGNHVSLKWGDVVFVGDVVMGWSTSLVSPPDGDMTDFLTSCTRLKALNASVLYSGHGAPITAPNARLDELITHRNARTAAILQALTDGPADIDRLVRRVYSGLAAGLHAAAARNVFAHLIALHSEGRVWADPTLKPDAVFMLSGQE